MSRWRYNGEQLAAIDAWAEASAPNQLVYLPRLRGDGAYEVMAVILDDDTDLIMEPVVVCFLEVHADGKITQTDGLIRWDEEGCEGPWQLPPPCKCGARVSHRETLRCKEVTTQ